MIGRVGRRPQGFDRERETSTECDYSFEEVNEQNNSNGYKVMETIISNLVEMYLPSRELKIIL